VQDFELSSSQGPETGLILFRKLALAMIFQEFYHGEVA